MRKKTIAMSVLAIAIIASAYYWGYYCGNKKVELVAYDQLLLDISNYILIRDALDVGKGKEIKPLVSSQIVSGFYRMVNMYAANKYEIGENARCAISRRVRSLKKDHIIMSDESDLEAAGFSMNIINEYLNSECLGEPSHKNWMEKNPKAQ